MSTEKLNDRLNRILVIGLVPLNGESLSGSAPAAHGAHLINSSAACQMNFLDDALCAAIDFTAKLTVGFFGLTPL